MTWPNGKRYTSVPRLTKSMKEGARLLLEGKSIPRVAEIIEVSPKTVEKWRRNHPLYREFEAGLERERDEKTIALGAEALRADIDTDRECRDVMSEFRRLAPLALNKVEAMLDDDNPRIRLAAAHEIFDPAGFVPPARRQAPQPRGPLKGVDRLRELDGRVISQEGRDKPQSANAAGASFGAEHSGRGDGPSNESGASCEADAGLLRSEV